MPASPKKSVPARETWPQPIRLDPIIV